MDFSDRPWGYDNVGILAPLAPVEPAPGKAPRNRPEPRPCPGAGAELDLISNQVASLMPSDAFGCVAVPVWVGYGSDAPKVRKSLPKAALENSSTGLYDPQVSAPGVYFLAFGDNLIDFELRFFIQNIDYRISVRSDTLFTLDDAFRVAGIEIPFPQRVVHLSPDVARAGGMEKKRGTNP